MDGKEQIREAFRGAETVTPPQDETPPREADFGGHDQAPPPEECRPLEYKGATFPLNDYGNGLRLEHYYGGDMLFVPRLGWSRWDNRRWLTDEDELTVRRDAQKIAGRILAEVDFLALEDWERDAVDLAREVASEKRALERKPAADRSEEDRKRLAEVREITRVADEVNVRFRKAKSAHRAHARSSGNSNKITNMLGEAKTAVACAIGDLNANPLMVNVENGTLLFKQELTDHDKHWGKDRPEWVAELLPHDRAHRITKMMAVRYEPDAPCPHWDAFLERVQPSEQMRGFLQRFIGYSLTGKTDEQKLVFNYGAGRNGKSTFADILARIFADYATTVPIETLTGNEQRKGSDATPDLVRLPGARFVRASEPEQGTRMKEAMIKALTGGEAIMIRRMMQEFVEVIPEFKLMISGNHKPEIRGSDDGIWRRVLLVPWETQIPEEEVDPMLGEKLWAERSGIFAWAVRGFLDWAQNGLGVPDEVREATDEYRQESDKLRLFLQTECRITGSPDDFVLGRDLAGAFNAWMIERGDAVWGNRALARAIKDRSTVVKGPEGQRFEWRKRSDSGYGGILLTPEAEARRVEYLGQVQAATARK